MEVQLTHYRVRDIEALREKMKRSQRVVPHSVRSLAALVGVKHSTIGYLMTGRRPVVTERLARAVAVGLGATLDDLFVPESSLSRDMQESGQDS